MPYVNWAAGVYIAAALMTWSPLHGEAQVARVLSRWSAASRGASVATRSAISVEVGSAAILARAGRVQFSAIVSASVLATESYVDRLMKEIDPASERRGNEMQLTLPLPRTRTLLENPQSPSCYVAGSLVWLLRDRLGYPSFGLQTVDPLRPSCSQAIAALVDLWDSLSPSAQLQVEIMLYVLRENIAAARKSGTRPSVTDLPRDFYAAVKATASDLDDPEGALALSILRDDHARLSPTELVWVEHLEAQHRIHKQRKANCQPILFGFQNTIRLRIIRDANLPAGAAFHICESGSLIGQLFHLTQDGSANVAGDLELLVGLGEAAPKLPDLASTNVLLVDHTLSDRESVSVIQQHAPQALVIPEIDARTLMELQYLSRMTVQPDRVAAALLVPRNLKELEATGLAGKWSPQQMADTWSQSRAFVRRWNIRDYADDGRGSLSFLWRWNNRSSIKAHLIRALESESHILVVYAHGDAESIALPNGETLSVADVRRMSLRRRPVVFLVSCQSAGQPAASSLARALRDAGASAVVGFESPVIAAEGVAIADDLFKELQQGVGVLEALRATFVRWNTRPHIRVIAE